MVEFSGGVGSERPFTFHLYGNTQMRHQPARKRFCMQHYYWHTFRASDVMWSVTQFARSPNAREYYAYHGVSLTTSASHWCGCLSVPIYLVVDSVIALRWMPSWVLCSGMEHSDWVRMNCIAASANQWIWYGFNSIVRTIDTKHTMHDLIVRARVKVIRMLCLLYSTAVWICTALYTNTMYA